MPRHQEKSHSKIDLAFRGFCVLHAYLVLREPAAVLCREYLGL
jgi:hypothetical protein